jgi:hypothetical protein
VPFCAHAHVRPKISAKQQTAKLRFTKSHSMDSSFRAPHLKVDLYASGQRQADTKTMWRFAGSQPGEKIRPWATFPTTQATVDVAFRPN